MITKDMTIQSILEHHEDIAPILMASGMHCLGCAMAHGETLEQACYAHEVDPDQFLADLKAYLAMC